MLTGDDINLGIRLLFDPGNTASGLKQFSGGFRNLAEAANRFKSGISSIYSGLGQLGGVVTSFAAQAQNALRLAANEAVEFEFAVAKVGTAFTNKGEFLARRKELRALAMDAAQVSSYTAKESANAMEVIAKAGADSKEELAAILPYVLDTARVEGLKTEEVADTLLGITRQFGRGATSTDLVKNIPQVSNTLVRAAAASSTSIDALQQSFRYGGAAAHNAKVEFEDTAAMFAAVANTSGMKGSRAGTSLSNMLTQPAMPRAAESLALIGVELTNSEGKMKNWLDTMQNGKKIPGILSLVKEGLNDLTDEAERMAIAQKIFGIQGLRAFRALTDDGGSMLERMSNKIKASTITAKDQAEIMNNTVSGMWSNIKANMGVLAIEVFNQFAGVGGSSLKATKEWVHDLASAFRILGESPGLTATDEKFAGLKKTAVGAALGIKDAIEWVKKAIGELSTKFSAVKEFFSSERTQTLAKWLGIFVLLSPAITAASGALTILTTLGGGLFSIFGGLVKVAGAFAAVLGTGLWPVITVVATLLGLFDLVREYLNGDEASRQFFSSLKTAFKDLWSSVKDLWEQLKGPLMDALYIVAKFAAGTLTVALMIVWGIVKAVTAAIDALVWTTKKFGKVLRFIPGMNWLGGLGSDKKDLHVKDMYKDVFDRAGLPDKSQDKGGPTTLELPKINVDKDFKQLQEYMNTPHASRSSSGSAKNGATEVSTTIELNLDGRTIASNLSRRRLDYLDRAGSQVTPYQRRQAILHAATV